MSKRVDDLVDLYPWLYDDVKAGEESRLREPHTITVKVHHTLCELRYEAYK